MGLGASAEWKTWDVCGGTDSYQKYKTEGGICWVFIVLFKRLLTRPCLLKILSFSNGDQTIKCLINIQPLPFYPWLPVTHMYFTVRTTLIWSLRMPKALATPALLRTPPAGFCKLDATWALGPFKKQNTIQHFQVYERTVRW